MPLFKKILIANRGEIAVRVARTCKEMGITAVGIYSDADKTAYHTTTMDEVYALNGTSNAETYLNYKKILAIAAECGAEAIHPGYGFLSENEEFIDACEASGIAFIGPSAKSVSMMGSKTAARQLMSTSGVPIVPGTIYPIESVEDSKKIADNIGYPVLLKAAAGGGGKGMKKVYKEEDFIDAFNSAQREAAKSFGDSSVYIEKLFENPKHIEVQVIGDKHGNYAHIFERECSVQRRHQKIIEEAPSPVVSPELREKLTTAAVNAAKACNYYNAGTIEFLLDGEGNFYFLEMNTRLQVEHPITELISGLDLVREQICIAAGLPLSFKQEDLSIRGHAIECRVYAEDPAANFLPTTGKIRFHQLPSGPGVRCDEGIDTGSVVTINYDPLLTKLSVWSRNREESIVRMREALKRYYISGMQTNIEGLLWILEQETFNNGSYTINFIDKEFTPLLPDKWKKEISSEVTDVSAAVTFLNADSDVQAGGNGKVHKNSGEMSAWERRQYE